MVAAIFLAWDNTDLIPARNLQPFGRRFKALAKTPLFHLGFGLPFLVPVLNLLFLSFAPVGATLYHIDRKRKRRPRRHPQNDDRKRRPARFRIFACAIL
jgi:CysZ protein